MWNERYRASVHNIGVCVEITACNKIGMKLSAMQADCLLVLRKLDNLVKLYRKPVVKLFYATAGVGE